MKFMMLLIEIHTVKTDQISSVQYPATSTYLVQVVAAFYEICLTFFKEH